MKKIVQVIFSDTKQQVWSTFENMAFEKDHIVLFGISTYVDYATPHIEEFGCDYDGNVVYNPHGFIYFDAVDRIDLICGEADYAIFEKALI